MVAYKHSSDPPPVVRLDLYKNAAPGVPLPAPRYYQVLWATDLTALSDPAKRTAVNFAASPPQPSQTGERLVNVSLDWPEWYLFCSARHLFWMGGSGESLHQDTWSWSPVGEYVINHNPVVSLRVATRLFRLDRQHRMPQTLRLDGSLSKDADSGTVLSYEWSLLAAPASAGSDPGASQFVYAIQAALTAAQDAFVTLITTGTHVPPAATGVYEFGLTVTDNEPASILYGTRGRASTVVAVEIAPPFGTLSITAPTRQLVARTGFEPVPIRWEFSKPLPDLSGATLTFSLIRPRLNSGQNPVAVLRPSATGSGVIDWHGLADGGEVPVQTLGDDRNLDILGEVITKADHDVHINADAILLDPYLAWVPLLNWAPHRDQRLVAALAARSQFPHVHGYPWKFQSIWEALGPTVNLDFFGSLITVMPQVAGAAASPGELIELVRLDFDGFLDHRFAHVEPYSTLDTRLWAEGRIGTAMHFDMSAAGVNVEDGAVLMTYRDARRWVLTTLTAPGDGEHPVSGHREWGIVPAGPGQWLVYTRGADRPTGMLDSVMSFLVFDSADRLWDSFARSVTAYVNANGGVAKTIAPIRGRESWNLLAATYGLSPR